MLYFLRVICRSTLGGSFRIKNGFLNSKTACWSRFAIALLFPRIRSKVICLLFFQPLNICHKLYLHSLNDFCSHTNVYYLKSCMLWIYLNLFGIFKLAALLVFDADVLSVIFDVLNVLSVHVIAVGKTTVFVPWCNFQVSKWRLRTSLGLGAFGMSKIYPDHADY